VIVVCGETLIDLVPAGPDTWRALAGGGPANTAVALRRLDTETAMLARISGDAFGEQLRARLVEADVDLRYVVEAPEPSTLAVVSFDENGSARYGFYVDGTADWQWQPAELPAELPADVRAVHAGSMALAMAPGGPVLESLLARERDRRVVSIDPNVRSIACPDHERYRALVERWLGIAHIVKVSDDDVRFLYPGDDVAEVAGRWATAGPSIVVMTKGAQGATASTSRGETVAVPGESVEVVDTIGAGDTFSAAMLAWLDEHGLMSPDALRTLDASAVRAMLAFGVRAAAITCTRAGADPPTRAELDR
jgi:fructokinase